MKKRILALLLTLSMVVTMLSVSASAADLMIPVDKPDTVNWSEYELIDPDTGVSQPFSYDVPTDGVTVLIFYSTACSKSISLFKNLSGYTWLDDDRLNLIAIEIKDHTAEEIDTFMETYAAANKSVFRRYSGDRELLFAYFNLWSSDTSTTMPVVAVITESEERAVVRFGGTGEEMRTGTRLLRTLAGLLGVEYKEPLPFRDVQQNSYFYEAVRWAVEKEITTGTSATAFSPDDTCTRGQVATFLWRAMGEPEPESNENPFVDVEESDYFYQAVLWAVEQGITTGMDAKHFGAEEPCTRAQVATFLWRASGQPGADALNPFADVKDGDYFYDAVLWALENEITTGTSAAAFSPDAACTRGQIVTFLYRAME